MLYFIMPELRRRALRRGFALVAALSLLASASGIPMCVSIWSHAAPHCPMHGPEKAHQHHSDAHSIVASLASLSGDGGCHPDSARSEEHTSELQSRENLVCRLLLEKKKKKEKQ